MSITKKVFVYILRTSSGSLYTGQTNNLEKRMKEHAVKKTRSAKYMKKFNSFELVYTETCSSRSEALKREYEIKKMRKKEKEELISSS